MKIQNIESRLTKNLHLLVSSFVIFFIALYYGVFPEKTFPNLFDFEVDSIDLKNIFRSLMSLYFGMITLWIFGILKPSFRRTATIGNIVFMLSLAFGRILSLLLDGLPSVCFVIGFFTEILLAFWGIKNLAKHHSIIHSNTFH